MKRVGVILLDGEEIIIRIYEEDSGSYILLHNENRDLASFTQGQVLKTSDAIEVIAEISFMGHEMHVTEWKMFARHVPEEAIRHISSVTGLPITVLLLTQEQDLLCKALLTEPSNYHSAV